MTVIDRLSIEPSRRCSKGCAFCYNGSSRSGNGLWTEGDLLALASDAARNGVRALSLGGGEPLEVPWLFSTLRALDGVLLRSLTTNGLPLLDPATFDALVRARPDKVHVSIHAPENEREVARVIEQVTAIARAGIASGVNLLVRRSRLSEARVAFLRLEHAGLDPSRVVLLPMRDDDTPSPADIARVAGTPRFQSMTCLSACGRSPRFASLDADRRVAWCSYTRTRRALAAPTYAALLAALGGGGEFLGVEPCTGGNLVKLGARAS